jgi:hypothetical protein
MSFPFVQPYFGLGNSLQTAQASGGGAVGGWVELARTTLGSDGDSIDVTGLADKRYLMALINVPTTGNARPRTRFNADTGTNYADRWSQVGGGDNTTTSQSFIYNEVTSTTDDTFAVCYASNLAAQEKLTICQGVSAKAAGAATAPHRSEVVGKWANTSNAISQWNITNDLAGDYTSGAECVVLGWDPDDTHTTNFWEELGEITIGSAASSMTSSTFTAKKYLWVQGYIKPDGTDTITPTLQLGNGTIDTGNNYSTRYSYNGGSDGTITSNDTMEFLYNTGAKGEPIFFNTFIVNNASNEKLSITEVVAQEQAGNTSDPERSEGVGKWSNTSNQANILKIDQWSGTGNLGTDSIVKIWGSD